MSKQRIPPFLSNTPLQSNPSLSRENISSPTYIVKLEEVNPPLYRWGGGEGGSSNYVLFVANPYFAPGSCKSQN